MDRTKGTLAAARLLPPLTSISILARRERLVLTAEEDEPGANWQVKRWSGSDTDSDFSLCFIDAV